MLATGCLCRLDMRSGLLSLPFLAVCAGLLMTLAFARVAHADDADVWSMTLDQLLSVRVTTASKSEQSLKRVAATISIVTREDIRLSGARNLPDLLRQVPGIDSVVALASHSSLGIRGLEDPIEQLMTVLIDGRMIYDDFIGSAFFEALPISLEEIERIEVIRGPSSTLWGANAATGVINIITARPRDLEGTSVRAAAGQFRTRDGSLIQAGQYGHLGYSLSAGYASAAFWDDADSTALRVPRANAKLEWSPRNDEAMTLGPATPEWTVPSCRTWDVSIALAGWDMCSQPIAARASR